MKITITLNSINSRTIDEVVRKILVAVPVKEFKDSYAEVAPAVIKNDIRTLTRKIIFVQPTDKAVKVLSKIDVPHDVDIFIR